MNYRLLGATGLSVSEIGLGGEFRAITSAQQRVKEAARLGFTKIALPKRTGAEKISPSDAELVYLTGIYDILRLLKPKKQPDVPET